MFSKPRVLIGGLALGASLLTGCFYPADRGRALETRVQQLEGENQALRDELDKTRADLNETVPKIDGKIAEVTRALDSLDKASRRTDADTGVLLQKTIEDLAGLRGQIDTYVFQLGELRSALERVEADTEKKMLGMMSPEQIKAYEARKKLQDIERPDNPKAFLDLASARAKAGETTVARKLYDEFFKKWPRDPLAGEAHFGLGEVWFSEEKCREALFEFGKVIQEYPKTPSAPEAYLRSSDCFAKLKMNDESRLALEEVVKNHPKSAAAKTAKTRLASGKGGKKKGTK